MPGIPTSAQRVSRLSETRFATLPHGVVAGSRPSGITRDGAPGLAAASRFTRLPGTITVRSTSDVITSQSAFM